MNKTNKYDYVDNCLKLIESTLDNKRKKIVLLPHAVNREDSDVNIIKEIEKLVSEEMKGKDHLY